WSPFPFKGKAGFSGNYAIFAPNSVGSLALKGAGAKRLRDSHAVCKTVCQLSARHGITAIAMSLAEYSDALTCILAVVRVL
ncbi:MAG: hypothetical protein IJC18_03800, partial [Clostridia bacterium]|nr:hypothetical protein [Clostridia bacterium]